MTETLTHPLVLAIRVLRGEVETLETNIREATLKGQRKIHGMGIGQARAHLRDLSLRLGGMEEAARLAVDARYGFEPFTSQDYFNLMREDA